MLQIKRRIIALLVGLVCAGVPARGDLPGGDWLLKDAFEEEYIPLSQVAFTEPGEVREALGYYHSGNFRKAAEILEKVRALKLPDGRLDFVTFVLAECYRQLGCDDLARNDYSYVIRLFPASDKTPASLYRLLDYAVHAENLELADSICSVFQARFRHHPLANSVFYINAYINYKQNDNEKAVKLLRGISLKSSRLHQSWLLSALCYLQLKDYQKALMLLDKVRAEAGDPDLASEAEICIGDIYYLQNNIETAYKYYREVSAKSKRYQYAMVKSARAALDMGKYDQALETARRLIGGNRNGTYYFEMASIMEQAYLKLGRTRDAAEVSRLIHRQIVDARIAFEIYDEIDQITTMMRSWQSIEHRAIRSGDTALLREAVGTVKKLLDIEDRHYALLKEVSLAGVGGNVVPYHAERRYLAMLKADIARYDDTLAYVRTRIEENKATGKTGTGDSVAAKRADSLDEYVDILQQRRENSSHEYDLVIKECIGKDFENREADEDMQAKFVDWSFMKYQDKKEELRRINLQLSTQRKAERKPGERKADSAKGTISRAKGEKDAKRYSEADRERAMRYIADDRERLKSHIATIFDVYPKSKYNAQILFRLAELHFDEAGDRFQESLQVYERKMAQGNDTAGLEFPEYHLDSALRIYDKIVVEYPRDEIASGAYYYKALALQKIGKEEEAAAALLKLITAYPQSEYFVEANMNIGKYYFDHPRAEKGRGYKLAEEAYRRVLFFRDHPEYVSALYHLGWCYYMQDRYEEAIAVFKYLIEESNLDFDPSKMDEKQMANPLLRGEAIDYIAISFDAENKVDDAIQFLKLVGNTDYSAMVLKRIGELREEDLDYNTAIRIYRRLLAEYPNSREAPATYVSLIRLYDSQEKKDSSMMLREKLFEYYTRGGEGIKAAARRDSSFTKKIDSMAISNGLYVADATYRKADSMQSRDDFAKAASHYQKLTEQYPNDPRAAEALWNLAVILDLKLLEKPPAFDKYIAFSKLKGMDSARREQAALNAVAIAQALLPPDTVVEKGVVDFAASKVVEAVDNYTKLFPRGSSWGKVVMGLGAIYYNRHLFSSAAKIYERIVGRGEGYAEYYEALLFLGQCHYGEENWPGAITTFEKVYKQSKDPSQGAAAYKILLQSEFLNAKKFFAAGQFAAAAELFRSLDEKYPGSEYGDIALFNSAEAQEKTGQLEKACDRYFEIIKRYPNSKLAPDALFNAAGNYEKVNKFDKAAGAYETIASDYPASEKAKDALFNVGFCYEKLGKLDKMADANERYSSRYPGEKDVEAMLLRSAAFYAKASMWERAISVYRNFIRRYPRSPKAIEAYFMIGKCYFDQGDKENAFLAFDQTERENIALIKDNLQSNNYSAAEAAYHAGLLKREKFLTVKLALPDDVLKRALKEKSDLLAEAVKAFQHVMQYRSERMFEAAYRVGQLYEDLSAAWRDQERPKLDPIKAAVLDKDILTLASVLLQKSFIPYEKAIELARGFDSLGVEQKTWVAKSQSSLKANFVLAGEFLFEAVGSMSSAPVPQEIREKPLHYYQYIKQLLETLLPMKEQARDYYSAVLGICDSLGIKGPEIDSCRGEFAHSSYFIGEGYDRLSSLILKNSKELSKDMPPEEREDLVFQMEDIVFEVQDKAIFAYEDALKRIKAHKVPATAWTRKIVESLARLSPEKYGASYFHRSLIVTNGTWIFRTDSVARWNTPEAPSEGWRLADTSLSAPAQGFSAGPPRFIGGPIVTPHAFLWKNFFLNGAPRSAAVSIATPGTYRLFINGTLILSDTIGNRPLQRIDSATGIASVLKGGDNSIAAEIKTTDNTHDGMAVVLSAMIDTSEHFTPAMKVPRALASIDSIAKQELRNKPSRTAPSTKKTAVAVAGTGRQAAAAAPGYIAEYRNRSEMYMAIDNYGKRERRLAQEYKKERLETQRIVMARDSVAARMQKVKAQIDSLKAKIAGMTKSKGAAPAPSLPKGRGEAASPPVVRPPSPVAPPAADTAAGKKGSPAGKQRKQF